MDDTFPTAGPQAAPVTGPGARAGLPGRALTPTRPDLDAVAGILRGRLDGAAPGSLWAALLERGRVRLVVPLRDRPPERCDEDAEDRALLALLDAVGVPDVVLAVARPGGRPLAEDRRLWRRARSGSVGLTVRLLGLVVVSRTDATWAGGPAGPVPASDEL